MVIATGGVLNAGAHAEDIVLEEQGDVGGTPHEIMVYTMNAPYRDQLLPVSSRYTAVVLQGCLDASISPQQIYDADEKYRKAYKARAAPTPKKHAPER